MNKAIYDVVVSNEAGKLQTWKYLTFAEFKRTLASYAERGVIYKLESLQILPFSSEELAEAVIAAGPLD